MFDSLYPYLVVIFVGFLPTEIWRWLAVFLGKSLSEDAPIIQWVRYVASALLAGVVAKLLLAPSGALAQIPDWGRYGALVLAVLAYFIAKRSVITGVIVGECCIYLSSFFK